IPGCSGLFSGSPTAFVGVRDGPFGSCPAHVPNWNPPPADGMWLQPGDPPPDAHPVTNATGETVVVIDTPQEQSRQAWYHGVFISLGVGPDPTVAQAVFDSVGASMLPDTRVAQQCERNPSPKAMPRAERLGATLTLDEGKVTMDPPRSGDEPAVAPTQVWQHGVPKSSLERYRLILTRFSSEFPAKMNPD